FMVSLLKTWYGEKATKDNEFAFDHVPKPAANPSWLSIFDQALQGKMDGLMLSGMTATSIGPDSNQVLKALSNLKWLCVMDAFPTTSSEFWRAPGINAANVQTEVFMLPATHLLREDGHSSNSRPSPQFWPPPGITAANVQTDVFMLPATHWIEKDGSFTNSGRWAQWKEQVLPPEGQSRHDQSVPAQRVQPVP